MEAYVVPLTSCLVASPNTTIALGASPAIKGDNEWSGIVAILWH